MENKPSRTPDIIVVVEVVSRESDELITIVSNGDTSNVRHPNINRRAHPLPPYFRKNNPNAQSYDPLVASFGPYHHGKSHLYQGEQLKGVFLAEYLRQNGQEREPLIQKIMERIGDVKDFYVDVDKYVKKDIDLATMMLLDACLLLHALDSRYSHDWGWIMNTAYQATSIACYEIIIFRDIYLLENQIPYWVVESLNDRRRNPNPNISNISPEKSFHYLMVHYYRFLPSDQMIENPATKQSRATYEFLSADKNFPSRAVRDLKAKGVRFRPSSNNLRDIKFESYYFHGVLYLPTCHMDQYFQCVASNVMALEVSPSSYIDFEVSCYASFMRSLIQSEEDVKELQEKGILFCNISNEEVVRAFKEMGGYQMYSTHRFIDVRLSIDKHCKNKAKTWMADLRDAYFKSPWTAIALFAAIVALGLSFVQAYYAFRRGVKSR